MLLSEELSAVVQQIAERIKVLTTGLSSKQDTLVSGTNIKTVNGSSLLGSGDLHVSLPDITESKNSASPNATVPVVQLAAAGAEANIDIAIVPKGTGAVAAQGADGTATGGNKRGANAVDWQTKRSGSAQVASGQTSTVSGGSNNTASGQNSTISGGSTNVATGPNSTVSGGTNNTVSTYSTVSGGTNNTGSGVCSTIPGGAFATSRGVGGVYSWAGNSAASGITQTEQFVLYADTAGATAKRMTTDGALPSTINGPILPNTATYYCRIRVLARNTTTGDSKSWTGAALIHREANAAATAFIGTPTLTSDFASSSLSAITAALSADTANGGLAITVTGLASTNIRWVAHVETLEATN